MKGPFPGMDPFLERRWGDFHTRFVTYLSDVINPSLPQALRARVEERIIVESEDDDDVTPRSYRPDAHVFERSGAEEAGGTATLAEPVADPVVLQGALEDDLTQRSLVIVDAQTGGHVITAIELLSPSNKQPGRGRREYLRKQDEYLDADVNLLELDFLLGGEPTTVAARMGVPPKHRSVYHASLRNVVRRGRVELYPISLREPLPSIALPLRKTDKPIALKLQAVFGTTYDRGYYAQDTRYDQPIDNAPDGEGDWMSERLSTWQRPTGKG